MNDEKQCARCEGTFPLTSFKKLGSAMTARSPTGATHSNNCKACRELDKAERKEKRDARQAGRAESTEAETEVEGEDPSAPKLSVPMALGIQVTYNGVDFVLTQTSGEGEATVWLAPHELRRLWEFAEGLAVKATAEAVPTA